MAAGTGCGRIGYERVDPQGLTDGGMDAAPSDAGPADATPDTPLDAAADHCGDGLRNEDETDVDCGGSACPPCEVGQLCQTGADCVTGSCNVTCLDATCSDGIQNQDETDVDCGGSVCGQCAPGDGCVAASDCDSAVCAASLCRFATCTDGVKNQDETNIDCGGSSCGGCPAGNTCASGSDCLSSICTSNLCEVGTCADGVANQDETDLDCGGSICGPCTAGDTCAVGSDCDSGVCIGGLCRLPTCTDGVKNQDETDVDCGGSTCGGCADGGSCGAGSDCTSGVCSGGLCQTATCSDGVQNQNETDVDCGGNVCGTCTSGSTCSAGSDCTSGVCSGGICQTASCSDGVQNGDETGVDCGGSVCSACSSSFGTPTAITELNTASFENDPALRYDGLEMYFSSTRDGNVRIYVTTRASMTDPWGAPIVVTKLGTANFEKGPELSVDGMTIFFTSDRNGSADLFMSTRPSLGGQWSNPTEVTELNTGGNELKPTVFNNGLGLIWMTNGRGGSDQDLWQSRRSCDTCMWSTPVELAELNTSSINATASWARDNGLELYTTNFFGAADKDIGYTTRTDLSSPFASPTRVEELYSAGDDTNPTLTADQSYIVFSRNNDLWHATR